MSFAVIQMSRDTKFDPFATLKTDPFTVLLATTCVIPIAQSGWLSVWQSKSCRAKQDGESCY